MHNARAALPVLAPGWLTKAVAFATLHECYETKCSPLERCELHLHGSVSARHRRLWLGVPKAPFLMPLRSMGSEWESLSADIAAPSRCHLDRVVKSWSPGARFVMNAAAISETGLAMCMCASVCRSG